MARHGGVRAAAVRLSKDGEPVETDAQPARPARLRWVPNALSVARLLAVPWLLTVLIRAEGPASPTAALIFGAVAATDFLDGALARRLGAETKFGRIVDPLADRLLVTVGLVGVALLDRVNPAGPAILFAREVLIILGFGWLLRRGIEMRVDLAGKISSALAMFGIGGVMLLDAAWVEVLFWTAVAASVLTFAHYARIAVIALRRRRASTRP
jgi:CDP-diacylglycerol--glycerol-3-phosphate 3-phosphatidyltransferase